MQSTEILPVEDWLGAELDRGLKYKLGPFPGVFYASSLGEDARRLYLKYLGLIVEEIDAESARRMGTGNALHDRWKKDLQKAGLLVVAEKPVAPHPIYPLHGRIDFIAKSKRLVTSKLFLLELKTKISKTFTEVKEPDYMALSQWVFYSVQEGIPDGYIIYEDMGTQEIKYFQLYREERTVKVYYKGVLLTEWPGLVQALDDKLAYVTWCLDSGNLPEKCADCLLRCRQPKLCKDQENTRPVVSQQEWKRGTSGTVRTSS